MVGSNIKPQYVHCGSTPVLSAFQHYTTFHSIDGVAFKSLSRPFQITENLKFSKYTSFICREISYIYEKCMSLEKHIVYAPNEHCLGNNILCINYLCIIEPKDFFFVCKELQNGFLAPLGALRGLDF